MAWLFLAIAGLLEISWPILLKSADGFTRPLPSAAMAAAVVLSFLCMARAVQEIPMGTAYAVWTGIGAAGIAIAGMIWFGEPATALRMLCIGLVVLGIVGLKLAG
jgi:quaternary ammonium compound-resistance protein SugE